MVVSHPTNQFPGLNMSKGRPFRTSRFECGLSDSHPLTAVLLWLCERYRFPLSLTNHCTEPFWIFVLPFFFFCRWSHSQASLTISLPVFPFHTEVMCSLFLIPNGKKQSSPVSATVIQMSNDSSVLIIYRDHCKFFHLNILFNERI